MNLPIIVVGAGGHAKVVIEAIHASGRQVLFATEMSAEFIGKKIGGVVVRGPDELISESDPGDVELAIGVGSVRQPLRRREIYERWTAAGYAFAAVIHPAAVVAPSAVVTAGAQVIAGAVIQVDCHIGENSIVNTRASIDHDTRIGAHVHIAPGATVCGEVEIGDFCHVGAGAIIIQGTQIGAGALVGAGAVVLSDVTPGATVSGVPAREHA